MSTAPLLRVLGVLGLTAVASACSSGADPAADVGPWPADAERPDGGPDQLPSGAILAAPVPPAPPVLTPCRPGWRVVEGAPGEPSACEPFPATGRVACADGEAHYPGSVGCTPVGDPCPPASERFRADLPAGVSAIYVDPDAAPGGDGSRTAPLQTIAAATAAASGTTLIALAAADFDEAVVLPDGVELVGACAARTHLTFSTRTTPGTPTLVITGTEVTVRNLTIAGSFDGVLVEAGASAALRGIALEDTTQNALWVRGGGVVTLEDVVIRDVIPDPVDGQAPGIAVESGARAEGTRVSVERTGPAAAYAVGAGSQLVLHDSILADGFGTRVPARGGYGIVAQDMAEVELHGVVISRARSSALRAASASRVVGTDLVIEDTEAEPGVAGSVGAAVRASGAGSIHLERIWIRRALYVAVVGREPDSRVELVDAILEDTRPNEAGEGGGATLFDTGAQLSLTRVLLRRFQAVGLLVDSPDSGNTLTDVRIRDVSPESASGDGGRGLQVLPGASLTIERLAIERATGSALAVFGNGSVTGSDLDVRDTRAAPGTSRFSGFGLGLFASEGISLDLSRVAITGSMGIGVLAGLPGTTVTLRDVRVTDTVPAPEWASAEVTQLGRAFDVQTTAVLSIERGILDGNHEVALFVSRAGTSATLHDVVVRDTGLDPATQSGGRGLQATAGGVITGGLVRLERNREIAIASYGEGSRVDLTDLEVFDTIAPDCFPASCPGQGGGIGLAGYDRGAIRVERFAVRRSVLCGVQVAADASVDLAHGEVSGSEIGANVQVPGYDLDRLQDDVVYRDNVRALDSTELPIPSAGIDFSTM